VYYLMRNEVDSTELDDVYLEQSEEDSDPAMGAVSVTVTTETTETTILPESTPADSQPDVAPPSSQPSA